MNTTAPTQSRWGITQPPFIVRAMPWFIGAMCVIANVIALIYVAVRTQ